MTRSEFGRPVLVLAPLFALGLSALAMAAQNNEYYGSTCQLTKATSDPLYTMEVTELGTLLKPHGATGVATLICPAFLTTTLAPGFRVKDISFSVTMITTPAKDIVSPTCQGVMNTVGTGLWITPGMGPDSASYAADSAFLICWYSNLSNVYIHGFKSQMTYFTP